MSEELKHVMSMRVGSAARVVSGSRTDRCYKCNSDVWVSPSSEGHLKDGYQLICNVCGIEVMKRQSQSGADIHCENLMPNNVQLKEIAEALQGPGVREFKYSR